MNNDYNMNNNSQNENLNLDFNFYKPEPDYKEISISYLKGKWIHSFLVFLIVKILSLSFLSSILNSFIFKYIIKINIPLKFQIIMIIILGISLFFLAIPFEVGIFNYCTNIKNKNEKLKDIFYGFKIYKKTLITGIILNLIISVGFILFIIPGIILSYVFSMTPFILIKDPKLDAFDALKLSFNITKKRKMDIFLFDLSFIGWRLLSNILTLSIGDIFLQPYYYTAKSILFENLWNEYYKTEKTHL